MSIDPAAGRASGVVPGAVIAKIRRHVLILPFALAVLAILDRSNLSYAALKMNVDLGFSAAVYGLGAGILFIAYCLFGVPSNLMLERFGARRWLARIAVAWGLVAMAMALVRDEATFYLVRFLLGAAEAGLFPGVVLYLTYWFPARYRGRANSLFFTAVPLASVIGSPLSAWLVSLDGALGLSGWQFMFVVQGAPAIVIGILFWKWLIDEPGRAPWLEPAERQWLAAELAAETAIGGATRHRVLDGIRNRVVWWFSLAYFCYGCGQYGLLFFLPQIIERMRFTTLQVGLIAMLPYAAGLVAMVLVSRHADRSGERRLHFAVPMLVSSAGLLGAALTLDVPWLALLCMTVVGAGIYSALGAFWPLPTALLSAQVAATGIAMINSLGNLGGFTGPYAMGFLRDRSGTFLTGLILLSLLTALGGIVAILVTRRHRGGGVLSHDA